MTEPSENETIFCEILPELCRIYEQSRFADSLNVFVKNIRFGNDREIEKTSNDVEIKMGGVRCLAEFQNCKAVKQKKMSATDEMMFGIFGQEIFSCSPSEIKLCQRVKKEIYLHVNLKKEQQTTRSSLFEAILNMLEELKFKKEIKNIHQFCIPFVHFGKVRISVKIDEDTENVKVEVFNLFGSLFGFMDFLDDGKINDDLFLTDEMLNSRVEALEDLDSEDSIEEKEKPNPTESFDILISILQNQMNLLKMSPDDVASTPLPYLGIDSLRLAELEYHISNHPEFTNLNLNAPFLVSYKTLAQITLFLDKMKEDKKIRTNQNPPVIVQHSESVHNKFEIPLSSQQKRILFVRELEKDLLASSSNLTSQFDESVLLHFSHLPHKRTTNVINHLIITNSILRTQYSEDYQYLLSGTECFIAIRMKDETFILDPILPIRCILKSKQILQIIFNHISIDGRSLLVFYRKFKDMIINFPKIQCAAPALQHYDYCRSEKDASKESLDYWTNYLKPFGTLELEKIPHDFSEYSEILTASYLHQPFPKGIQKKFDTFCLQKSLSRFELFMGVLEISARRVFGISDPFAMGFAVDQRTFPFFETIGCFTNVLFYLSGMDNNLENCQKTLRESRRHQDFPYESIVKLTGIDGDLFNIFVVNDVVEIDSISKKFSKASRRVRFEDETIHVDIIQDSTDSKEKKVAKYSMTWYLRLFGDDRLHVEVEYADNLFRRETIETVTDEMFRIINGLLADNERIPVKNVPRRSDFPTSTVSQIISGEASTVRYRQKDVKIYPNKLSSNLFKLQIQRYCQLIAECPIVIHMPRGPDLIQAVLGAWSAGFYSAPLHRDATEEQIQKTCQGLGFKHPIVLRNLNDFKTSNLRIFNRSSSYDLAYVTSTSGSTGKPKLVGTSFQGHSNLARQYTTSFQISSSDTIGQVVDPSFDIFFADIVKTFTNGARLLLARDSIATSSELLSCTNVYLMPAFLSRLPDMECLKHLETLQYGGEPLAPLVLERLPKTLNVWQEFGLTEQTVYSARRRILPSKLKDPDGLRKIGECYDNIYVEVRSFGGSDDMCKRGQLILKGIGLMRGYFEVTRHSLDEFPTGDEVRKLKNGEIVFIGRKDSQVKVRGHRIDLFEIECVALSSNLLEYCTCIVSNSNQLALFYKFKSAESINDSSENLQKFLEEKLISYKVPQLLIHLEQFPLTRTGKVDRKQLLQYLKSHENSNSNEERIEEYSGSKHVDEAEKLSSLLLKWLQHYSKSEIDSLDSNIFTCGVDSISVMLTMQKLRTEGFEVPVKMFFKSKSVRKIVEWVLASSNSTTVEAQKEVPKPRYQQEHLNHFIDLNHIQQRILFSSRMTSSDPFLLEFSIDIPPRTSEDLLCQAVNFIVMRNQMLRSKLSRIQGEYRFILFSGTEASSFSELKSWTPIYTKFQMGSKSSKLRFSVAPIKRDHDTPATFSLAFAYGKTISNVFGITSSFPIATTFANRTQENWNTVSMFANTLPLVFDTNQSSEEFVERLYLLTENSNIALMEAVGSTGHFADFALNYHKNLGGNQKDIFCQFPVLLTYSESEGMAELEYDGKWISEEKAEQLRIGIQNCFGPPAPHTEEETKLDYLQAFEKFLNTNVSENSDFFHSGGHSLTAMKLIDYLSDALEIEIPLKLIFEFKTPKALEKAVRAFQKKDETLESTSETTPHPQPSDPFESFKFPLSRQQNQMFYLSQLTEDSLEYQLPFIQPFPATVCPSEIHRSLLMTIQEQNIFRTVFKMDSETGEPYQEVVSMTEAFLRCHIENVRREEKLHDRIRELCEEPIDVLSGLPLLKASFVTSSEKHVAFLHLHHLISDARSTQITNSTMKSFFEESQRSPIRFNYTYLDYCRLEQKEISNCDGEYLETLVAGLGGLKIGNRNDPEKIFVDVPKPLVTQRLASGDSPFSVFLRIVSSVLLKCFPTSSQFNIAFPALNRNEKTSNLCGYFLNNLLINSSHLSTLPDVLNANLPYSDVIRQVRKVSRKDESVANLYINCRYDLEYDESDDEVLLDLVPLKLHFPIEIDVDLLANEAYRITLRSDRLKKKEMMEILKMVTKELEVSESKLDQNREKTIYGLKKDTLNFSIPVLYEKFLASNVTSKFAVSSSEELSYRQLHQIVLRMSQKLSREFLIHRGTMIRSDDVIAVVGSKSIQTTVRCLAVQFAGAAYLPIDKSYPEERRNEILKDSLFVFEESGDIEDIGSTKSSRHFPISTAYCLSYVITTSGTTGRPKSVAIGADSLANLCLSSTISMRVSNSSRIFQFTNFVFDNSVLEVSMALASQATLIYGSSNFDPSEFEKSIEDPGITHCLLFPSLVQSIEISRIKSLPYWIVGGERLPQTLLDSALDMGIRVIQNYGPTETTAFAISKQMKKGDLGCQIGHPAINSKVRISKFDESGNGEILISGRGRMRGYFNREMMTSEWYSSGDICRISKTSEIEFIGRTDSQVKVRGYRVELSEIEKIIESHPDVKICKAIFEPGTQQIHVFYKTLDISSETIRSNCERLLEPQKIPSTFNEVGEFPLTGNSKIDKVKLMEIVKNPKISQKQKTDSLESELSAIWISLLNCPKPSESDNFFLIGGHSLLLIRLRHLMQTKLNIQISVPDVLENLKFGDMITLLKKKKGLSQNQKTLVFFPALYGGCTTYLKMIQILKTDFLDVLLLDEESGETVDEVAERYKNQIWAKTRNSSPSSLIFIGASSAGTLAFATSQKFRENVTVVLLDSGTFWNLIEHLDYSKNETEMTENLKNYQVDIQTARSMAIESWKILQILKNYKPEISIKKIHILSVDGSDLGWSKYSRNLKTHKINGDHYSMLQDSKHVLDVVKIAVKPQMAHYSGSLGAFEQFRDAFGLESMMSVEDVRQSLQHQKQLMDIEGSRQYVEQFIKKCESRDPNSIKPLRKRVDALMNESEKMTLMMDFLVRCRQAHIFRTPLDDSRSVSNMSTNSTATPTASIQSSPFQRRSASRGRVLSTLTGDHATPNLNESITSRSRANSSFTSYDQRALGIERQLAGSQRPRSPYRMGGLSGIPTTRVSPLTASNQLFSASNTAFNTPSPHHLQGNQATSRLLREDSPNSNQRYTRSSSNTQQQVFRQTPRTSSNPHQNSVTSSVRAQLNQLSNTPIHARLGNAKTETESTVCECLLFALIGIESRLFRPIHRKMTITSTASISTTHLAVCHRVLSIANLYLLLSHKESHATGEHHVTNALLASIRNILGEYIGDMDEMRRIKDLKFHHCLPLIEKWQYRMTILLMAYKARNLPQLELLESMFILHSSHSFEDDRKFILDKLLDYTLGVFCYQMMEWMTTGEVPAENWMIAKDDATGEVSLRKVPIFMTETDARILLEIGKSLPHVGSASDDDLESIDKATTVVRAALSPELIFKEELTPVLKILRDVVCGIVMRMVLTTGRLKEHIHKATSFFFLSDPRFTITLYTIIKEASMGLRVGSASLSRQTVSSALAAALEATTVTQTVENKKKQKLKFTLDSITSLGSTPNVSSKMQFVQPLSPHYEPQMPLMKPIFAACDDAYESIFHVIWAIDLARCSSQETLSENLPGIMRFLVKNYSLRENATCLVNMIAHIFSVVNASLLRLRSLISVQLKQQLARFLAALDEKCIDVDDVIKEHVKFVRRVSVVVFVRNNEKIEHELANLLRVSFEAQEFAEEFSFTWHDVIEATTADDNVRKARIAEICQRRTIGARVLLETVNKCQKNLNELLDELIMYGNDALLE
ncbi:hypothetical protein L3Y34_001092 [Caenorhabditis briggsae]|uniref:Carrier domain-containing protein n=2 Tax=Caenorhabditis briggsae TaxID=6238 RepID=A0AAE9IQG3_CAEBR|nr:hypothetical protein L3Y34_001092 [Caenorhabditis briggsae]